LTKRISSFVVEDLEGTIDFLRELGLEFLTPAPSQITAPLG
jgi:hypothetical protein